MRHNKIKNLKGEYLKSVKFTYFLFFIVICNSESKFVGKYTYIKEAHELAITSPFTAFENGKKEIHLGQHVLAEFFDCDPNTLNSIDKVEKYMVDAALECGATIVQKCFHMFNPYGVSGVVIISESHLAIHTWPELGYAAVDLFTCGDKCDPKVSYEFLKRKFNSKKATFTELKRGIIDEATMKVMEKPFEIMQESID